MEGQSQMDEIACKLASRLFDRRLIQNQFRSTYVEAMIEPILAPNGWQYTGDEWAGWDFARGDDKLEVKQSAVHQTWSTDKPSAVSFDIAERAGFYTGPKWTAKRGRSAHVYVFAYHPVFGSDADHRVSDQWQFFVVQSSRLPSGQRKIGIGGIRRLAESIALAELSGAVENAIADEHNVATDSDE
jgi:hypothetical protein